MAGDSLTLLACGIMVMIIQKYKREKQNSCVVCFLVTAGVGIACDAKAAAEHHQF